MLDCKSISRAINPAPGACFNPKFISLAQVLPGPVLPYSAEWWPKTPFIFYCFTFIVPCPLNHISGCHGWQASDGHHWTAPLSTGHLRVSSWNDQLIWKTLVRGWGRGWLGGQWSSFWGIIEKIEKEDLDCYLKKDVSLWLWDCWWNLFLQWFLNMEINGGRQVELFEMEDGI